jgi:hypothetical protein
LKKAAIRAKKAARPSSPSSRVSDAFPLTTVSVTVADGADEATLGGGVIDTVTVGVTVIRGVAVTAAAPPLGLRITVGFAVTVGVADTTGGPETSVVSEISTLLTSNTTASTARASDIIASKLGTGRFLTQGHILLIGFPPGT